jgi:hypothetical protein
VTKRSDSRRIFRFSPFQSGLHSNAPLVLVGVSPNDPRPFSALSSPQPLDEPQRLFLPALVESAKPVNQLLFPARKPRLARETCSEPSEDLGDLAL